MINQLDTKTTAYLHARGIGAETIARYRIEGVTHNGRAALRYPTFGEKGAVGWRIKFIDGAPTASKYTWIEKNGVNYYSPGMLMDALEASNGVLYILNGEPAIWAHHAYQVARGKDKELAAPSIAWFGETSVPMTLAQDLEKLGAKQVFMFPDCDAAGYKTALKVHNLLTNVIPIKFVDLPFPYDSKKDFNDLWISSGFDAAKMPALKPLTIETIYERDPSLKPAAAPMQEMFRASTNGNHSSDVDFPAMQREWIDCIIAALGSPAKMEGRVPRWHCPIPSRHRGGDKNPSFTVDREKMRPRCSCDIEGEEDAWGMIAQAKGLPTWLEYRKEHTPKSNGNGAQKSAQPAATDDNRIQRVSHDGDTSMDNVLKIIRGDTKSIGNPVVFPLRCLYDAGGLCQIIPSGKMVGIVGGSGTGKTALGDTIVDYYSKIGIDCILSSDEWTPNEVMARRIQRYTGYNGVPHVTLNDWNNHILWLKESDLGVPVEQRAGVCLSDWQIKTVEETANKVKAWKGKVTHIYEDDATQPVLYFEDFLALVAETLTIRRKANRRADVVLIDYLSLLRLRDVPRGNEIEFIGSMLKNHCLRHKYVPFVLSQVTKNASKNAKVNGQALTSDDAQFMRSDKYNLMLAINTEIVDDKPTGFSFLSVEKNSLGKTRVRAKLRFDAAHLTYEDKNYEVQLP